MHTLPTYVASRLRDLLTPVAVATLALVGAACSSDHPTAVTNAVAASPAALIAQSGDAQSATVSTSFTSPLTVRAVTSNGTGVAGRAVAFNVTSGLATLSVNTAITDSTGRASTVVTAGVTPGTIVISATVSSSITTTFTLTSTAATSTANCTPTSLAVGAAAIITGTAACVTPGSATAEYALIPFNASTNPSANAKATLTVNATGVTAVSTTIAATVTDGSSGTLTLGGASASVSGRRAFELGLRARERAALESHLSAARSWYAAARSGTGAGARLNVIPSTATVGSLYSLNSNADQACTNIAMRTARVMAIGKKALIVADTLNPSGGFTTADYQAVADTFDLQVDAVDTKNFGQPTDIDGNGHVILFFTSAVNALTPKNAGYYIGGFFYGRDLLPTSGTSQLGTCAGSNTAEMFYLLVPDPTGSINGNTFTKTFVQTNTIATTAHEYQHLINASRRMYVNTAATDFEDTWLDEGLAHVAEELVFYARSGLSPLTNIDATLLRSNNTYRTVFNEEGINNFGRLWSYIEAPTANSPYADNDSLATRGATWSFLRYAVDQQGTSAAAQSTLWFNIVNSNYTGLTNLGQVFPGLPTLFRDWATSLLLDDVSGAAARYQSTSWNLRSVFGAINSGVYPLATQSLSNNASTAVSLLGGGAAYLRFGVAAGTTGSLTWTTSSSNVQTTLVRLK